MRRFLQSITLRAVPPRRKLAPGVFPAFFCRIVRSTYVALLKLPHRGAPAGSSDRPLTNLTNAPGKPPLRSFRAQRRSRICLALLCAGLLPCTLYATKVYKADGTVFEDVKDLQEKGDYYLFTVDSQQRSINKYRIRKIVNDQGETIYKKRVLTAEQYTTNEGNSGYVFYHNGEQTGKGHWNEEGVFVVSEGELPSGTYKLFYDTGAIKSELSVKNGTLHGVCKNYFESGQLKRKAEFDQGKEEGTSRLYYKSGELKGVSHYENGLKNGKTRLFFPSGEVKAVFQYKDGRMHGVQKMYFPSGQLKTRVQYKIGSKHGPIKQYYRDGTLQMEGNFVDEKLDGKAKFYNRRGELVKTKSFKKGRVISSD